MSPMSPMRDARRCLYCLEPVVAPRGLHRCDGCGEVLHPECFGLNHGCSTYGCIGCEATPGSAQARPGLEGPGPAAARAARLVNEAVLLRAAFAGSPVIEVTPIGWDPFSSYQVVYSVPGVMLELGTQPVRTGRHTVRVEVGPDYPRLAPRVVTGSAVFHPNLGADVGDAVVFAVEWTAARTLIDVVVRVAEMLQYQAFDLAAPTNAVAASWAGRNSSIFPIGDVDVSPSQEPGDPAPAPAAPLAPVPRRTTPVSELRV